MNSETSVNCPICKRSVPVIDLRMHEGKRICGSCYTRIRGKEFSIPHNQDIKQKERKKDSEIRYVCNSCGYKFFRPEGFENQHVCPFCGGRGAIQRVASSQELISMASKSDIIDEDEALAAKKKRVMGY